MNTKAEYIEDESWFPWRRTLRRKNSIEENTSDNTLAIENGFVSKADFLRFLRIEKRRADRSKTPLSIVLFSMPMKDKENPQRIGKFVKYLSKITRESDIKGWIDHDLIGLLLPDTDEKGGRLCLKKILRGNGQVFGSATIRTYPDYLFGKLLAGGENPPILFPFDLDGSVKPPRLQWAVKRGIDVLGSLSGLLLLFALMGLIALVVKVSSPGPCIFKQTRMGLKGKRFSFYKFRSMYSNADDRVHREYVTDLIKGRSDRVRPQDGECPFYKMKDDGRITPVGKIIRKLSMDELPQLFNVLKGEMSLVGPRPPLPYEVREYEPWHLRRILEMKPGITGLWQVNGRSRTNFNEMVRLDLRYVQKWSLWLDVKILVKTVKAVLQPHGAA